MPGTPGTIRDIRTGRAIGKTHDLTETFTRQVEGLISSETDFYIVHGRCRHRDVRKLVHNLRNLAYVPLIYDQQFPSDTLWIFEGLPEELGFDNQIARVYDEQPVKTKRKHKQL